MARRFSTSFLETETTVLTNLECFKSLEALKCFEQCKFVNFCPKFRSFLFIYFFFLRCSLRLELSRELSVNREGINDRLPIKMGVIFFFLFLGFCFFNLFFFFFLSDVLLNKSKWLFYIACEGDLLKLEKFENVKNH